jgi:hypothetical protein
VLPDVVRGDLHLLRGSMRDIGQRFAAWQAIGLVVNE